MKSMSSLINVWSNNAQSHKAMHEALIDLVNQDQELKAHRDFVEQNIFGFGERSFQWLWNVLVSEMPKEFTFLEIGVFKGQILSLIELLATRYQKIANRYGVTPLSNAGGVWESDYARDIALIHDRFHLKKDYFILKGDSTDPVIIKKASSLELDMLYIDGGHTYEIASSDIRHYAPLVKSGGYLIVDDCANDFPMPFGFFNGIDDVTRAVKDSQCIREDFEFVLSVVHIKVWRKK